jgi:hypothetical protein
MTVWMHVIAIHVKSTPAEGTHRPSSVEAGPCSLLARTNIEHLGDCRNVDAGLLDRLDMSAAERDMQILRLAAQLLKRLLAGAYVACEAREFPAEPRVSVPRRSCGEAGRQSARLSVFKRDRGGTYRPASTTGC